MNESVSPDSGRPSKIGRMNPNSLKNLAPPWKKGQSGHPGRSPVPLSESDQSNDAWKHTLDAALSGQLVKPRNRREKIVLGWIRHAVNGSWPHLDGILKRKLPLPVDQGGTPNIIIQGVRLELSPDVDARTAQARLAEYIVVQDSALSASEAAPSEDSSNMDALTAAEESRAGGLGATSDASGHCATSGESTIGDAQESQPPTGASGEGGVV